ncbi:MAG: thiamine-phosphate kinase, partial [Methanoregula sp.]
EEKARKFALYGGGDYELIFTLPPEKFPIPEVPFTVIGKAIPEKVVIAGGKSMEKRGYQHKWT